tara:strand:+ start:32210 stop:32404 length:195 start_codon:yes stop_codon:yes gene_type:complete
MKLWKIKPEVEENELPVEDEVTDEIEIGLWYLKDKLDLPTEEVEVAVNGRREYKLGMKRKIYKN